MKNISKAETEFTKKLIELQEKVQPALYGHHLKEIVIYEKLLDIQEQLNKLLVKVEENNKITS
jgi:hypothetical protein